MNLKASILKEHTKDQCNKIVRWVGNDQERFNELFQLFLNGEYRVTQRAAWPLSYSAISHQYFMQKNFRKLLDYLKKPGLHNSVKRNSIRLMQAIIIPEEFEGEVMELCFTYLAEPKEAVAVKAFSLTVLEKLSKKYPEIIPELNYFRTIVLPKHCI